VCLFPASFTAKFKSVQVRKAGKLVSQLSWANFGNGDRQHWRSTKAARDFPYNCGVVAELQDGKKLGFKLFNPKVRTEA
jgi:hypothetical protein